MEYVNIRTNFVNLKIVVKQTPPMIQMRSVNYIERDVEVSDWVALKKL